MINHWLYIKERKATIRLINGVLLKFIGRNIYPLKNIYEDMQKVFLKFIKNNPEKLKFLTNDVPNFKYSFEVEDQGGYITNVSFKVLA